MLDNISPELWSDVLHKIANIWCKLANVCEGMILLLVASGI